MYWPINTSSAFSPFMAHIAVQVLPMISTADVWTMDHMTRKRPMVTTERMQAHGYCGHYKTKKNNCSDYNKINKQDYTKINKQATNARLLQLLHILHPLGIKSLLPVQI